MGFYQTEEEGNTRKAAALAKRVTCVANAEAAYAAETASYAASLSSQNDLLDYEFSVVGQMRAAMNGEEFGASPEMESILQAVEAKISDERTAAQNQHDADVASSLAKQNSDIADCNAAEQAVIDKWDTRIAAAQAAWDAAAVVEATEIAEYNRLVGIKNDKQELYDAAVGLNLEALLQSRQLISPEINAQVQSAFELVAQGLAALRVRNEESPVQAFPEVRRPEE